MLSAWIHLRSTTVCPGTYETNVPKGWVLDIAIKQKTKYARKRETCLLVACLTSQQHASVSQGRICSDNCTCCHTETEVADPTFHLSQSQYTDTGPTSPSADPITPCAWQGSQFLSHWYDSIPEKSCRKRDLNPGSSDPLSRRTP